MSAFSTQPSRYPTQADIETVRNRASAIFQEGIAVNNSLLNIASYILDYLDQYITQGNFIGGSVGPLSDAANEAFTQAVIQMSNAPSPGTVALPPGATVLPSGNVFVPGPQGGYFTAQGEELRGDTNIKVFPSGMPPGATVLPSGNVFVPGPQGGYFSPQGTELAGDTYRGFAASPTMSPFGVASPRGVFQVSPGAMPSANVFPSSAVNPFAPVSVNRAVSPMSSANVFPSSAVNPFAPVSVNRAVSPMSSPRFSPIPTAQASSPFASPMSSPFASPRSPRLSTANVFTAGAMALPPPVSVARPVSPVFASSPFAGQQGSAPSSPVFASSPFASPRNSGTL